MVIDELLQVQQELSEDIDDLHILHMKILLEYDILLNDGLRHKTIDWNLIGVNKFLRVEIFMLSGLLLHIRLDIMPIDEYEICLIPT